MNYLAHLMAAAPRGELWFSVGSILPDLWRRVAGRHLVARQEGPVAEGVLFHRYVDRRYHTSEFFRRYYQMVQKLYEEEGVRLPARRYFFVHLLVDVMWDCVLARTNTDAVISGQELIGWVVAGSDWLVGTLRECFFVSSKQAYEVCALLEQMERDGYFYRLRDVDFGLWLVVRTYQRVVGFRPQVERVIVRRVVEQMEGQVALFGSVLTGYYREWVEGAGAARSGSHPCE